jgi:hypothetical protein
MLFNSTRSLIFMLIVRSLPCCHSCHGFDQGVNEVPHLL